MRTLGELPHLAGLPFECIAGAEHEALALRVLHAILRLRAHAVCECLGTCLQLRHPLHHGLHLRTEPLLLRGLCLLLRLLSGLRCGARALSAPLTLRVYWENAHGECGQCHGTESPNA
jgi:hypothetical protein